MSANHDRIEIEWFGARAFSAADRKQDAHGESRHLGKITVRGTVKAAERQVRRHEPGQMAVMHAFEFDLARDARVAAPFVRCLGQRGLLP